ncbi:MAG: winged helix-turn-helix domain-containing protein [Candidatus Bathyarchaeia archaeon]|jgi:predicted transcriptional regulator
MTKSKLEIYEDVLKVLTTKSLTLDEIAFESNMDCMLLNKKLEFLIEHGLVEQIKCKGRTVYSLTYRGTAIYKTLTLTKRLEHLQANIETSTDAAQPVQTFPAEAWKAKRKL